MFKVIQGNYGWDKWSQEQAELMQSRQNSSDKFENLRYIITTEEDAALMSLKQLDIAIVSDINGRSLAHISVSSWDSAARLLIEEYKKAKNEKVVRINDRRIRVPMIKDNKNVLVLDSAYKRLNTWPMLLRA